MNRVSSFVSTIAFGLLFSGLAAVGTSAQTLTSDAADYPPGATAYLTGAGFFPNESVKMQVVHADGEPSTGEDHDPWYVDADADGNFVTSWHVCEDDCVGETLLATADGETLTHAETLFTDAPQCGDGQVSMTAIGGSCLDETPPQAGGPYSFEVIDGGSYQMTISGVTECTGDAITVFVQHSLPGGGDDNFCFTATSTGVTGQYSGTFTMPPTACNTYPVSYKCGAGQPCNNNSTFNARGPAGNCGVHLRAATFGAHCALTGADTDCTSGCTPCVLVCPDDAFVDCSDDTSPSSTGTPTGCASTPTSDDETVPGDCAGNYTIIRHWSADDGCGGTTTCDQTITVTDMTAPVIDIPATDKTVECDGSGNEAALAAWLDDNGGAHATDDCSGVNWTNDFDELTNECGETGSATVKFTAEDDCGNASSTTATFTIVDTTDPTIDCPENFSTTLTGMGEDSCCVADEDIGEATGSDDCSGVTFDHNPKGPYCVSSEPVTVTWTATDDCGNQASCTQTVTILGRICATKFYDANANGVFDGNDTFVEGWQIVVSGDGSYIGTTGADGTVCFDVPAGSYTVTEGTPTETNWVHTTAVSFDVTIGASDCSESVAFGNYCFSTPSGGFTLGYWTNKNGQKALEGLPIKTGGVPCWVSALNNMACFRNANGTLHTFSTYADLKTWLSGATATNMAYMLSAQLAANVLSGLVSGGLSGSTVVVVPGKVTTGNNVCIVPFLSVAKAITCGAPPLLALTAVPGVGSCACGTPASPAYNGLVTVKDLRDRACCLLQAYGTTTAASTQRTYQECVKNILDMLNNNGNNGYPCGGVSQFINPNSSKCPATFGN